jgi:hypothetical protein
MCISVRGALARLSESRGKRSEFQSDKGKPLTRLEAIDALMDELAQGHEVIPMGSKCGNPCGHADKGCTGFDYGKGGGCPGYRVD